MKAEKEHNVKSKLISLCNINNEENKTKQKEYLDESDFV